MISEVIKTTIKDLRKCEVPWNGPLGLGNHDFAQLTSKTFSFIILISVTATTATANKQ
jgi:hypothetical protein